MWAMYCLVLFYFASHEDLAPIRPLSKFLCVKLVVFASFWQSIVIDLLFTFGVIKESESWTIYDEKNLAAGLQDFIICIEMVIAAIAHAYAFPPRDYLPVRYGSNLCLHLRFPHAFLFC